MTDEQMADLAQIVANRAIAQIQKELGVKTGDFAGLYFSQNDIWNDLTTILFDYIRAEVNQ